MFFGGELGSRIGVVAPQSRFFELKEISSKKPKSVCSSLVGSRATILSGRWLPVNGDAASGAFAIVAAKITIWYVRSTGSAVPSHLSASSQNARGEIPCELFSTSKRALRTSAFLFWGTHVPPPVVAVISLSLANAAPLWQKLEPNSPHRSAGG